MSESFCTSIVKSVVNVILPNLCPLCGQPLLQRVNKCGLAGKENGISFCSACLREVAFITDPSCPVCGLPFSSQMAGCHNCPRCEKKINNFHIARGLANYDGKLLKAIHLFKYGGKTNIGKILGGMLAQYPLDFSAYDLIVPVPLHIKKLRERGFNQAVLLCREIEKRHSVPLEISSLKRVRYTESQVGLNEDERVKNIKGAFEVRDSVFKGLKTLLVDDIFTTGATVNECSRVLGKSGVNRVDVLTLARVV
jgi:ComF family protein